MGLQLPSERFSNVSVGSNVEKALTRYCGWTPVHGGMRTRRCWVIGQKVCPTSGRLRRQAAFFRGFKTRAGL